MLNFCCESAEHPGVDRFPGSGLTKSQALRLTELMSQPHLLDYSLEQTRFHVQNELAHRAAILLAGNDLAGALDAAQMYASLNRTSARAARRDVPELPEPRPESGCLPARTAHAQRPNLRPVR